LPPATSQPSNPASDFCAVLVLDANGRVTAVNGSGQELWPSRPLPGEMFPALFVF